VKRTLSSREAAKPRTRKGAGDQECGRWRIANVRFGPHIIGRLVASGVRESDLARAW